MAENVPPDGAAKSAGGAATSGDGAATAGIPYYEKQRQHLKELIANRKALEKQLAANEELIVASETDYLESTPHGNIITGFDHYIKGVTAAASQRRKASLADQNRVFSRSSISYNPAAADAQTPASTPASHAATPVSSSFGGRDGPSGAPTPSSAAGGGRAGTTKKGKRFTAGAEDSETDGREAKKSRTNFGARK